MTSKNLAFRLLLGSLLLSLFSVIGFAQGGSGGYAIQNAFDFQNGRPTSSSNTVLLQRGYFIVYPTTNTFSGGYSANQLRVHIVRYFAKDINPLPAACAIPSSNGERHYVTPVASYADANQINFNFTLNRYTPGYSNNGQWVPEVIGSEEPSATYENETLFECSNPYQSSVKEYWLLHVQYLHTDGRWYDMPSRTPLRISEMANSGSYNIKNVRAHEPHVNAVSQGANADLYIWNGSSYVFYKKILSSATSPLPGYQPLDNPKTVNGQPSIIAFYVTGVHTGGSYVSSFVADCQYFVNGTGTPVDATSNFVTGFAESGYYGTQQINWSIPSSLTSSDLVKIALYYEPVTNNVVFAANAPGFYIPFLVP